MPRADRLLRLLQLIRVMAPPITAARLADETGVSVRALYRDIDALRAAGARIEGQRGYGFKLIEDPSLPPQSLDRDEIEALALGLAEVGSWGDPMLAKAAASVLSKVAATLSDERGRQLIHVIARVFQPTPRYASDMDLSPLRNACWQEVAVKISYLDQKNHESEREILPLSLVYNEDCVTVLSWSCLREDFRMFRTDRITALRSTDRSFRPRRVALLRTYLEQLQGQLSGQMARRK
ncbi:helix-turn-helix transcriptional regulator [Novosphingobium decolorationis]|uniref:YafY family transcriptional regulator n=1 Tax=Novosphingobium decolorationis TaxID=2698673 RepID=A0ABX8EAH7_9SPHN|nr:YafY family protein [Novosphingobium decolorationis]QVM85041.1 YafY family transcriptional regulator [Novosphingobium decolorationis]